MKRLGSRRGSRLVSRRGSLATALLVAALPLTFALASCKQGEGQRCQVQSDCEDGLTCNVGEGVCRATSTSAVDALPPPDAAIDAPVDAPDAM